MALGANVRRLRDAKRWTLEDLSEASGVDVGTISALENRDSQRSKYVHKLADALEVSVNELQGDAPPSASTAPSSPAVALTDEQRRLLDVWARLSKNQRVTLMDQLQATAASNIEIAEHLRGLGIKGVVPDDEVERKLRPGANGSATAGKKGGKAK